MRNKIHFICRSLQLKKKMNFKFLLLSFCLTLKVTKVKSVVIAPMAAIFGAFSVVDTITLLLEIFNDKDDRVFELLTEYKNDVQQSNKLINDQVYPTTIFSIILHFK